MKQLLEMLTYKRPHLSQTEADFIAKYIAPLQAKGIKVIMGNLGDHTGAGFANLPQHKSVLTRMIWLPTTIS